MSDISHVIPIEEAPDKNKKILEIACSPNLKYVAVLYENSNISLLPIVSQEQYLKNDKTINIGNIYTKENGERIFAISDYKYVAISLDRNKPYNFITTMLVIDRFHLIASRKGERLLFISGKQYNLVDPYNLKHPKSASKLFNKKTQIQEPYIIKSNEVSDKTIYAIDGKLLIDELVPDNTDDWVKYLRKELKDINSITALSKKTIDIINKIINNKLTDYYNVGRKKEFTGESLKWGLEVDDLSVKLTVIDYDLRKKQWKSDDKKKELGDIKDIKMHYYWNYWNGRLDKFEFEMVKFRNFFMDKISRRILPASSYETIYRNLKVKFGKEEVQLFRTFLKDNVFEDFYLTCYGKILMETFIKLKDDKWFLLRLKFQTPFLQIFPVMEDTFIDILISNFWDRWIKFQNSHPLFRDSIVRPVINFYYRGHIVGHSSTILAIPLPNLVYYPKEYNFWKELLLPTFAHSFHLLLRYSIDQNDPLNSVTMDPNSVIEYNSSLTESYIATENMFTMMGSAISAVYLMLR
ncbi:35620_t:CDS:2, partial [Racocetra persica]